ncbi:hypothetical protein ACIRPT_38590 [Streptomyces sp. NPDC101227]|uniref:hypothetical protein n=1 Tax=Streptomyces sp. NPDC101227 TaxID=3366136 RepID=UPI00381D540A
MVLIDPADRLSLLPGGTIEETDSGDPAAALDRKAAEEAQLALGPAHYLGYQYDETGDVYGGIGPCARIRMAAAVTHIGPSAPDPSTGRTMVRLLVTPHQAVGLLGWGEMGHRQADAAIRAATLLWGYPRGAARPITEISPTGGDL